MILYRVFPRHERADTWLAPRAAQGDGRHDNPDSYGCLYASETAVSSVAEVLSVFRGTGSLTPDLLARGDVPLALATLSADVELVDLDDPTVLERMRRRPSTIATNRRSVTQPVAFRLWEQGAHGLRWWSTIEASWINVTLFDRALSSVSVEDVTDLRVELEPVREAAAFLGL